jgi:hypothetical protein
MGCVQAGHADAAATARGALRQAMRAAQQQRAPAFVHAQLLPQRRGCAQHEQRHALLAQQRLHAAVLVEAVQALIDKQVGLHAANGPHTHTKGRGDGWLSGGGVGWGRRGGRGLCITRRACQPRRTHTALRPGRLPAPRCTLPPSFPPTARPHPPSFPPTARPHPPRSQPWPGCQTTGARPRGTQRPPRATAPRRHRWRG